MSYHLPFRAELDSSAEAWMDFSKHAINGRLSLLAGYSHVSTARCSAVVAIVTIRGYITL